MNLSGKLRHPQPKKLLPNDVVMVIDEEEKYEPLIGATFVIGTVLSGEEDERIYSLCFYNGKQLTVYPDGETPVKIYSKRSYLELEKRTEHGEDIYYQRKHGKTGYEIYDPSVSLARWLFNLIKEVLWGKV